MVGDLGNPMKRKLRTTKKKVIGSALDHTPFKNKSWRRH